jgi:TonB family protein
MNRITSLSIALLISAGAASAALASPGSDAWVAKTKTTLEAEVAQAGLADDGKSVKIRVKLASDGADGVTVVSTSGSRDFDDAVKAAARKAAISRPPSDLVGRTVTFTLGQPGATAQGSN